MKLSDIAYFVEERISSENIKLEQYVTTDSLLQNKKGRTIAQNLPPQKCTLIHFKKGDVLLGNIRPYLKKIWYANMEGGCSQDVLVLRARNNLESKFLYALLMQDSFFEYEMKATKGSKMPRGDKSHIINFPCIDLKNKTEIGKLLSSLDDKIALNNRINAKLEQMVKRLYDYWFVQFDFPEVDGKPYKSNGGKMVWNEELKRKIPEGWEVKRLDEITKRVKVGFVGPIDKFYCNANEGYPIVRPAEMGSQGIDYDSLRHITEEFYCKNKKSQIHYGDILISRCGKDGIPNIYESHRNGQVLNAVMIEPNEVLASSYFIYDELKSENSQKQIAYGTAGSVQGVVNTERIASIKLVYNQEYISLYSKRIEPFYKQIETLRSENRKLENLRNKILPLLMNGQVVVE